MARANLKRPSRYHLNKANQPHDLKQCATCRRWLYRKRFRKIWHLSPRGRNRSATTNSYCVDCEPMIWHARRDGFRHSPAHVRAWCDVLFGRWSG